MKREECDSAIYCGYSCGPTFGNYDGSDIYIKDNCNKKNSCSIDNDDKGRYECHPEYKKSLFVKTAGTNDTNYFSVSDYEVYCIDYESKYTIDHLCKHPDIIWEYIETKDISEESLKQVDDDTELLSDFDAIHCDDNNIRLKISRYYLKNPSEFLSDTQLVNQQYDNILRGWLGNDYKLRLIYRASEHGYTAESFHDCCDDKGPTLIVIKSDGGWIFGGYTTKSWKCVYPYTDGGIYIDIIYL